MNATHGRSPTAAFSVGHRSRFHPDGMSCSFAGQGIGLRRPGVAQRRSASAMPCPPHLRSGRATMRVVALEEHYTVPAIVGRIDPAAIRRRGFPGPEVTWAQVIKRNELAHLGDARLA